MNKKKIIMILCVSLVASLFIGLIPGAFAYEKTIELQVNDQVVEEITINQYEKQKVKLKTNIMDIEGCEWQLLNEKDGSWISIYGWQGNEYDISYALVKSILNNNRSALRVAVTNSEGTYYSNIIKVKVENSSEALHVSAYQSMPRKYNALTSEEKDDNKARITIHYLDMASLNSERVEIVKPYVVDVEKGSNYLKEVQSPQIAGYKPFYNDSTSSAEVVELNYQNIDKDIDIDVYYLPIEVDYAIKYLFEDIQNEYHEDKSLYYQGKGDANSVVSNESLKQNVGNIEGFEMLQPEINTIKDDGSSVIECYFNRSYYLMQFDLNEGQGVNSIYASYQTPIKPGTPSRDGYRFVGWDKLENGVGDGIADSLPKEMPAQSSQYQALWDNSPTKYDVVYWIENRVVGSKEVSSSAGSVVSGEDDLENVPICGDDNHDHDLSCYQNMKYLKYQDSDQNVTVKEDGTSVVNVHYSYKEYTLRFYYARTNSQTNESEVVGGSTYYFGCNGNNDANTTIEELLNKDYDWGKVEYLPRIKSQYQNLYEYGTLESNGYVYSYLEFTSKYGSNLEDIWPIEIFEPTPIAEEHSNCEYKNAYFSAWNGEYKVKYTQDHDGSEGGNETIKGCYMILDENVIYDRKFDDGALINYLGFFENGADVGWSVPKYYEYNIMLEDIDSDNYTLYKTIHTYDNAPVEQQTPTNVVGFTYRNYESKEIEDPNGEGMDAYEMKFYYERNYNPLIFHNGEETRSQSVAYDKDLREYYYLPKCPSSLDPDVYEFKGWYATKNCCEGTQIDLSNETMPDSKMNLYAKWVAKDHQVNFFASYDNLLEYKNTNDEDLIYQSNSDVRHGSVLGDISQPISSDNDLVFSGWYYMDGNVKKEYIPQVTAINKDMNIFAEWVKNGQHQYVIRHVLKDDPSIKVADDIVGYGNLNDNINCVAKVGNPKNELYDNYNQGYYPTAARGSISISSTGLNEYTFYYVQAEDVSYTVKYQSRVLGNQLSPSVKKYTNAGYVTERFKPIFSMTPDAFYKSLVLSVVWDPNQNKYVGSPDNVITFYYDFGYSRYAIHHMVEKDFDPSLTQTEIEALRNQYYIDGSGGYEEHHVEDNIVRNSGTVQIYPAIIEGYEFIENNQVPISVINGKQSVVKKSGDHYNLEIEKSGSEIYFFYRKAQPEVGTLTISRMNASDDKQVFRYEIRNNDTNECTYVSVVGNSEVVIHDLPYGNYTITQENDWSWRYNDEPQTITINSDSMEVTMDDNAINSKWLNGNSDLLHNQGR